MLTCCDVKFSTVSTCMIVIHLSSRSIHVDSSLWLLGKIEDLCIFREDPFHQQVLFTTQWTGEGTRCWHSVMWCEVLNSIYATVIHFLQQYPCIWYFAYHYDYWGRMKIWAHSSGGTISSACVMYNGELVKVVGCFCTSCRPPAETGIIIMITNNTGKAWRF